MIHLKRERTLWPAAGLAAAAWLAALVGGTHPAAACDQCRLRKAGIYTGEFKILGNGTIRSWVTLDPYHKPKAIGVTFSETALSGLIAEPPAGMIGEENPLALPPEAAPTGFNHISVDWNPKGHQPPGVYDVPHFDFHFYLMSPAEQEKITAKGSDLAKCRKPPAAQFVPVGYICPPGTEFPRMGVHWLDPATPELHGQPFTQTFIYGFYDGKMNFVEPMITRAFLETKPDFTAPIKLPRAYPKPGYYPTRYSIRYDPIRKEYTVALEGLTYRGPVRSGV